MLTLSRKPLTVGPSLRDAAAEGRLWKVIAMRALPTVIHRCTGSPAALRRTGPAACFIPHHPARLTPPVGIDRDAFGERADRFRPALRAVSWPRHPILCCAGATPSFRRRFEAHGRNLAERTMSEMVRSGRCIQRNVATSRVHPPITRSSRK